jgi:hypothetical protein
MMRYREYTKQEKESILLIKWNRKLFYDFYYRVEINEEVNNEEEKHVEGQ